MPTMPVGYYDRHDPTKHFERHLFRGGFGLQSAELNEIQQAAIHRIKTVGDALFHDGDIINGCSCVVDGLTGQTDLTSGAMYVAGMVRGLAPAVFTIPVVGTIAIGVRMVETIVDDIADPALVDPASGTRNYQQPGAYRLKAELVWAWDGDGVTGQFYAVYTVVDGVLLAKEAPPSFDAVSQEIARYDRDSSGGTYVVHGFTVRQLADEVANQVYSIQAGRARVWGRGVENKTSTRLVFDPQPDLRFIDSEPHLSSTVAAQRINTDYVPVKNITSVHITAEKTETLTHGAFSGAMDLLPDSSVLAIVSVVQGATTYTPTTDYLLTAGKVDWSPDGAEPAPGSTYDVTYQYIKAVTPTDVDETGFTVTGALVGTLVQVSYNQYIPRKDVIALNGLGQGVWIKGVAAELNAREPDVPSGLLKLATITQTWTAERSVQNNGVRVVPMGDIAQLSSRIDFVLSLVAMQQLESDIHIRETGTKKGLFTDPFIDDSQRDAGLAQTGAIIDGILTLPITASAAYVSADITQPAVLAKTNVTGLKQGAITGSQKINPYMTFVIPNAQIQLTPSVDRHVSVINSVISSVTRYFYRWAPRWAGGFLGATRVANVVTSTALLSSQNTPDANLRQIPVSFALTGFGPGETLTSVKIDGVSVTPV